MSSNVEMVISGGCVRGWFNQLDVVSLAHDNSDSVSANGCRV